MTFPRYQSSATIQPLPAGNYQNSSEQVANQYESVAEKANAREQMFANAKAKEEGEQAGTEKDFTPQEAHTQAGLVFRNAAIEAHKAVVQMDISSNLQRIRDQVLDPRNFGPGALEKYQTLAKAYGEGALSSVPREIQPSAKNFFDHYNLQSENVVSSRVNQLTHNQLQYNLFDYVNTMSKQASDASFNGEMIGEGDDAIPTAAVITGQINQKLQAAVSTGLMSGQAAANLKDGYISQAHQEYYIGQFSRLLNADPSKASGFIDSFLHSESTGLNPLEKTKLVAQMHGMWRQYDLTQEINGVDLAQEMKSAIAGVQNGQPSSAYANTITRVQEMAPKKYAAFSAAMEAGEFAHTVSNALTYATPNEQQQILSVSKPQPFLKNGEPDPAYAPLIAAWHHANDMVKKINKQWADDPAMMAMKNPSVIQAFESRNVAATGPSLTDPNSIEKIQSVTRGTINPIQQMVNIQLQRGIPFEQVSVLTNQGAADIVTQLKSVELPQQVETLQRMFDQYGAPYAAIVSKDLQKAGLEFQPLLATAIAGNSASRGSLGDVMKALQANPKDIEKALPAGAHIKEVREQVPNALSDWDAAMLQSYNGDTTQHRAQMRGAITQYAAWQLANGKANNSTAAVKNAADTLINNFYNYPKVNGYKIALPKQIDPSMTKNAFTSIWQDAQQADLQVPGLYKATFHTLTNDQLQAQYKKDSVSQAHLAIESGDESAILVDNQNTPIIGKDGKRFRFYFKDLDDAFSDIRIKISQQRTFGKKASEFLDWIDPSLFKGDDE